MHEKESLHKQINKLMAKLSSLQDSELNAEVAEICQTDDAHVHALQENLRDRDLSIKSL